MRRAIGITFAAPSRSRRLLRRAAMTLAIGGLVLSFAGVAQGSQPVLNLNTHCNDGDTTTSVSWTGISLREVDVSWFDFSSVKIGSTVVLSVHGHKGSVSLGQTPANAYYAETHWVQSNGIDLGQGSDYCV
jgi:hypothetical protein